MPIWVSKLHIAWSCWTWLLASAVMGIHSSHWSCVAVHTNHNASKDHTDVQSSHQGFNNNLLLDEFHDAWLLFPRLRIHIPIYPGDIILIRGASLTHQAWVWQGKGMFVVVPLADCHLSPVEHVGRIRHPTPIFGDKYSWRSWSG